MAERVDSPLWSFPPHLVPYESSDTLNRRLPKRACPCSFAHGTRAPEAFSPRGLTSVLQFQVTVDESEDTGPPLQKAWKDQVDLRPGFHHTSHPVEIGIESEPSTA